MQRRYDVALAVLLAATGGIYANHFDNEFHFDDSHAVQSNPHITSLTNAGRFFVDATTFSALPLNQAYRPLLTLSLAFDYWWGGGLKTWAFHTTSFVFYLGQLICMFFLFRRIFGKDREWTALFGTAIYALHPISAESVNYIIQRGEVMSTLGVVGGLLLYVRNPRPIGWHLVPMLLGCLSKPPAVMMAPILAVYVYLFTAADEKLPKLRKNRQPPNEFVRRSMRAMQQAWPAFALALVFYFVQKRLTPPMATTGGFQPKWYLVTQPWITLHYFRSFFWPNELTADTDWGLIQSFSDPNFIVGVLFLIAFIGFMIAAIREKEWRIEAFGMSWFVLALLPTSLTPLAEVMNDHRMYFPHVGTAMLVASLCERVYREIPKPKIAMAAAAGFTAIVLSGAAYATYQRNEVWNTENSLWHDVTIKSPKNGRGLMNYGLTLMGKGDYQGALDYFERSHVILPNYTYVETNLGIVKGALRRDEEAEKHFRRAMTLSPVPVAHAYFARFLRERGRLPDARQVLEQGLRMQPDQWDITMALLGTLADLHDYPALRSALNEAKQRFPHRQELNRFVQLLAKGETSG